MTTATFTMETLISNITSLVTAAGEWIVTYADIITGNPLLLAFTIVSFVGLGVGLIRRLLHV